MLAIVSCLPVPGARTGGAAAVRRLRCVLCAARAGRACQAEPPADHLRRWLDAYTAGLITRADLVAVFRRVKVTTKWQVVPEEGAR